MAQFSQQEQNAMRREAARRAREMQQRVHPMPPQTHRQYADYPPEQTESLYADAPHRSNRPQPKHSGRIRLLDGLASSNPASILSRLDSDAILILSLMVVIYKDGGKEGCDKKLLMALAYLLT